MGCVPPRNLGLRFPSGEARSHRHSSHRLTLSVCRVPIRHSFPSADSRKRPAHATNRAHMTDCVVARHVLWRQHPLFRGFVSLFVLVIVQGVWVMRNRLVGIMFAALTLAASPALAQGQQSGALAGRVTSADRLPLPGVAVTVTSTALQGERTSVTDVNGVYSLPGL